MNFFVAGLPRSRTAWMSVFLAQSGRPCLHDGFSGCSAISEYSLKLGDHGDSSTGLTFIDVNTMFPDAPVVIIHKNDIEFEKCVKWCDNAYNVDMRADLTQHREALHYIEGKHIKQSEIDDRLEEIFTYLTGCEWMPHYANLKGMNIQLNDPLNIDMQAAEQLLNERLH